MAPFFGELPTFKEVWNIGLRRASMSAADINAWSMHDRSASSEAPASPKSSTQKAEPDTPVASYMQLLENSGPPSPLQTGRFGDSPRTQRYKRWYWRQNSLTCPLNEVHNVSSEEDVCLDRLSDSHSPAERLSTPVMQSSEETRQTIVSAPGFFLQPFPSLHESAEWVQPFGPTMSSENAGNAIPSAPSRPEERSEATASRPGLPAVDNDLAEVSATKEPDCVVPFPSSMFCPSPPALFPAVSVDFSTR